jgi:hypothetical protein
MNLYDLRYLFIRTRENGRKRRHSFPLGSKYYLSTSYIKWMTTLLVEA